MKNKPELLAPAGDLERLKVAFLYGADACYIGGSLFSLRANAINFSDDDIKEACLIAKSMNKKIYVTVNISLHSEEVPMLKKYLKFLKGVGVDAIIISDPSIIKIANEIGLEIHLSTQTSTVNFESVKFFKNQGITRIVLAREASLEEIKEIIEKTGIEIEVFIHGAMCSSYSGRCVLSNVFTNRDSNRGGCSQICRWDFDLLTSDKDSVKAEKPFTLSTKDLSQLLYLDKMVDANITSLKIEGRMRSIYYIATVVSTYRKALDEYIETGVYNYNRQYEKTLFNVANRDSITQFLDGNINKESQYYNGRLELSNQDFLGIVLDYEDGYAKVEQRNHFKKGDVVTFFGPDKKSFEYEVSEILDEDKNLIDVVRHPRQVVYLKVPIELKYMDMLRIKK